MYKDRRVNGLFQLMKFHLSSYLFIDSCAEFGTRNHWEAQPNFPELYYQLNTGRSRHGLVCNLCLASAIDN